MIGEETTHYNRSESSKKGYQYSVLLTIDVRRIDNQMLTDKENAMVKEMQLAAEEAIYQIMSANGNSNRKDLGSEMKVY